MCGRLSPPPGPRGLPWASSTPGRRPSGYRTRQARASQVAASTCRYLQSLFQVKPPRPLPAPGDRPGSSADHSLGASFLSLPGLDSVGRKGGILGDSGRFGWTEALAPATVLAWPLGPPGSVPPPWSLSCPFSCHFVCPGTCPLPPTTHRTVRALRPAPGPAWLCRGHSLPVPEFPTLRSWLPSPRASPSTLLLARPPFGSPWSPSPPLAADPQHALAAHPGCRPGPRP